METAPYNLTEEYKSLLPADSFLVREKDGGCIAQKYSWHDIPNGRFLRLDEIGHGQAPLEAIENLKSAIK